MNIFEFIDISLFLYILRNIRVSLLLYVDLRNFKNSVIKL